MPAAGSTTNGRSNKAKIASNSLIVTFKLPSDALQSFSDKTLGRKTSTPSRTDKANDRSSPASSTEVPAVRPSSADNDSNPDAVSTPATGATPGDTPRRKGVPGPKPGNKRANSQTEPSARARGRPGPKKKPRLYVLQFTRYNCTRYGVGTDINTGKKEAKPAKCPPPTDWVQRQIPVPSMPVYARWIALAPHVENGRSSLCV